MVRTHAGSCWVVAAVHRPVPRAEGSLVGGLPAPISPRVSQRSLQLSRAGESEKCVCVCVCVYMVGCVCVCVCVWCDVCVYFCVVCV